MLIAKRQKEDPAAVPRGQSRLIASCVMSQRHQRHQDRDVLLPPLTTMQHHWLLVVLWLWHLQTGACCRWAVRLDRFGEVMADTVVEWKQGDSASVRVLGKASGYGMCPSASHDAEPYLLAKAVLQTHTGYANLGDLRPADACHPIEPVHGGAVWVLRGTCDFANKTVTARAAGAKALLIGNAGKRKRSDTELVAIRCPDGLEEACESEIATVVISDRDSSSLFSFYKHRADELSVRMYAAEPAPADLCALHLWLLTFFLVVGCAATTEVVVCKSQHAVRGRGYLVLGMTHLVLFSLFLVTTLLLFLFFYRSDCGYREVA